MYFRLNYDLKLILSVAEGGCIKCCLFLSEKEAPEELETTKDNKESKQKGVEKKRV